MLIPTTIVAVLLVTGISTAPPTPTAAPIRCLDAKGQEIPEAANPVALTPNGVVARPRPLKQPQPAWPTARECKQAPQVQVKAIITTKGDLCGATIVTALAPECHPFGSAVLDAVKHWTYSPATSNGHPVAVYLMITYNFAKGPVVQQ